MLFIPVSYGELLDKLTILEIKKEKINDKNKLVHVNKEFNQLIKLYTIKLEKLYNELKIINSKLWETEDSIRIKEQKKEFDEEFIQLARSVYILNDKRYSIKNIINKNTNSDIIEVKSYK